MKSLKIRKCKYLRWENTFVKKINLKNIHKSHKIEKKTSRETLYDSFHV